MKTDLEEGRTTRCECRSSSLYATPFAPLLIPSLLPLTPDLVGRLARTVSEVGRAYTTTTTSRADSADTWSLLANSFFLTSPNSKVDIGQGGEVIEAFGYLCLSLFAFLAPSFRQYGTLIVRLSTFDLEFERWTWSKVGLGVTSFDLGKFYSRRSAFVYRWLGIRREDGSWG